MPSCSTIILMVISDPRAALSGASTDTDDLLAKTLGAVIKKSTINPAKREYPVLNLMVLSPHKRVTVEPCNLLHGRVSYPYVYMPL